MNNLSNAFTALKIKMGLLTPNRNDLLLQRDYLEEVNRLLLPFANQLKGMTSLDNLMSNTNKYIKPIFETGYLSSIEMNKRFELSRKFAIADIDSCLAKLNTR